MKQLAMLIAGLSLCVAAPALAVQRPAKPIKLPTQCANLKNSQEAAVCHGVQLDVATKSLEALIAEIKLKGKFAPDAPLTKTFDAAHDFWVKEMNLTCNAVGQVYEGGTLAMAEPVRCKVEMTQGREQLLRSLYRSLLNN